MKITYWAVTIIVAGMTAMGGIMDITHNPAVVTSMRQLGYPDYVMTILGVAKLLAVIALLVPRFPGIKEWAYAGLVFDMTAAFWSHNASGDHAGSAGAAVFLVLTIISYILYRRVKPVPQLKTAVS